MILVGLSRVRTKLAAEKGPKNLARMQENFHGNHLTNIESIPIALSDKKGVARFYVSEASSHHSLGLAHTILQQENFIEVKTDTLDSFCEARNIKEISVLKVDTEGFELEVLQGAERLLKERRVKNLVFEISKGVMERLNRDPSEVTNYLFGMDYKIYSPSGEELSQADFSQVKYQDFLATPS